ncbi:MAG: hypothetical protein AAFX85_19625 [Pseudomonadota bacterium]
MTFGAISIVLAGLLGLIALLVALVEPRSLGSVVAACLIGGFALLLTMIGCRAFTGDEELRGPYRWFLVGVALVCVVLMLPLGAVSLVFGIIDLEVLPIVFGISVMGSAVHLLQDVSIECRRWKRR